MLYNSNVKSVLRYSSEWNSVIRKDMTKVESFHEGCLRKICNIFWPKKIAIKDLYGMTGYRNVVMEKRSQVY